MKKITKRCSLLLAKSLSFQVNLYGTWVEANWPSSLSQGYLLSAFVCLYEQTNNDKYLDSAAEIFNSFSDIENNNGMKLWITTVDSNQFLWFEEVPMVGKKAHILNGHIAALGGLYSYYRVTHSPQALLLLQAGITTVKRHLSDYRRNNQDLSYFLFNKNPPDYGPRAQSWN